MLNLDNPCWRISNHKNAGELVKGANFQLLERAVWISQVSELRLILQGNTIEHFKCLREYKFRDWFNSCPNTDTPSGQLPPNTITLDRRLVNSEFPANSFRNWSADLRGVLDCSISNQVDRQIWFEWLPMYALTPELCRCRYWLSD